MHTDYVLDLLVVQNDLYKLLISCGMDRKVGLTAVSVLLIL